MKKLLSLSLALLLSLCVGCAKEENLVESDVESTPEKEEEFIETKEIVLTEYDTNKDYKIINNRTDLDCCNDGDHVELNGEVWGIEEVGTMGLVFQLEIDNENGYSIQVYCPKENLEELKSDDIVRIQGTYRGIEAWRHNKEGENFGAYHINAMNIYLQQ